MRRTSIRLLLLLLLGAAATAVAARWTDGLLGAGDVPEAPAPIAGPDLVFEPDLLDLGRVDPGEARDLAVAWRRTGPGDLRVQALDPGCGCLGGEGLPPVLPAGARGTLRFRFRGRSTPGPFTLFVRAVTDRPEGDAVRLRVRGFVGDRVEVGPRGIHVGDVRPGAALERAIAVRPPPDRDPGPVDALLLGIEGRCEVGPPADRSARGVDVRVRARAPESPGPFTAEVDVRVGEDGLWRVPLLGRVVPEPVGAPR